MSEQAPLAIAVDTACNEVSRALSPGALMGLKFAVMMRLGIDDPIAMFAAVEGSERLTAAERESMLWSAGQMMEDPDCLPLFRDIEAKAKLLLSEVRKR